VPRRPSDGLWLKSDQCVEVLRFKRTLDAGEAGEKLGLFKPHEISHRFVPPPRLFRLLLHERVITLYHCRFIGEPPINVEEEGLRKVLGR
jgi:hypothetical protein